MWTAIKIIYPFLHRNYFKQPKKFKESSETCKWKFVYEFKQNLAATVPDETNYIAAKFSIQCPWILNQNDAIGSDIP